MADTVPSRVDIAVVGAGPAGLTAALVLAATGAGVALVAPPAPPADLRTTALLSGSVEILQSVDAWAEIAPHAAPLRAMRLADASRRLVRAPEITFHARELELEAFGWNVPNGPLVAGLERAVAADPRIDRRFGTVTDLAMDERGARLLTADGAEILARLVVAADGRASPMRDKAGIGVRRWSYPQTALVLNLDHRQPHHDVSTEFHTETGPFTLVPLARNRSSLVCVVRPAEAEALSAMDDAALCVDLERRARSLLGAFSNPGPRQCWPMAGLAADRLAAGRLVLVAEAAHAFPPIAAQGLNLGIRDIAALATVVSRARRMGIDLGAPETVERYAKARRADVASRTYGVDLLNRSLLTDFLPVQIARAVTLQLARDVSPLRRLMMREGLRPTLFQGA